MGGPPTSGAFDASRIPVYMINRMVRKDVGGKPRQAPIPEQNCHGNGVACSTNFKIDLAAEFWYFVLPSHHNTMRQPSLVAPKPVRGIEAEKLFFVPCDIPSGVLASALKKQAHAEIGFEYGLLYGVGKSLVLFQALGAPLAVLGLERLIASGVKEITLLGFCGSLCGRFGIADIASVSRAFSEEGTSRHYFTRKRVFSCSLSLKKGLEEALSSSGHDFKTGTIVSMDAPYRETKSWLRRNQTRGAELVDMETSAVFSLAEFHGIKAASLQIVTDELSSGTWKPAFRSPLVEQKVNDCFLPLLIS